MPASWQKKQQAGCGGCAVSRMQVAESWEPRCWQQRAGEPRRKCEGEASGRTSLPPGSAGHFSQTWSQVSSALISGDSSQAGMGQ